MRIHGLTIGLTLSLAAALAACSNSSGTAPSGGTTNPGGGSSNTITANYALTGSTYSWFFAPTPDTVAAGGAVTFSWNNAQHNITFDPVAGAPQDVPTSNNANVSRTFMTPGTYNYHCTIHPMSGVIVVH